MADTVMDKSNSALSQAFLSSLFFEVSSSSSIYTSSSISSFFKGMAVRIDPFEYSRYSLVSVAHQCVAELILLVCSSFL